MKAVLNKWTYIEEKVLIGSLIFNTLLIFLQIIMRGAFNSSLSWSEELSRYIFIWQIWLGADLAFAYGEHIKVEMIYNWLPGEKAKNMLRILVEAVWLAFNIFLVVKGADLHGFSKYPFFWDAGTSCLCICSAACGILLFKPALGIQLVYSLRVPK